MTRRTTTHLLLVNKYAMRRYQLAWAHRNTRAAERWFCAAEDCRRKLNALYVTAGRRSDALCAFDAAQHPKGA